MYILQDVHNKIKMRVMFGLWAFISALGLIHISLCVQDQGQRKRDHVYIVDVLAVYDQVLGNIPLKERWVCQLLIHVRVVGVPFVSYEFYIVAMRHLGGGH